jgi:peptidoglycan/LPS O-acetylase OafA/YrhL
VLTNRGMFPLAWSGRSNLMKIEGGALDGTQSERIRIDIQALRGVAVLLVLAYHTGLGWVPAGYLGVDMFFTLSGFLITRIVTRDIDSSRFRYRDFYYRRARRILPAAFATLLLTVPAAAWLLIGCLPRSGDRIGAVRREHAVVDADRLFFT